MNDDHTGGQGFALKPQRVATGLMLASLAVAQSVSANENVARKPFAQWADLPAPRQFVVTPWYMESEAYHAWNGNQRVDLNTKIEGENYGVDTMQGIIAMEYGIAKKWAADLNIGITTVGTRSFNSTGSSESTTGLMDTTLGVRYQICNETETESKWIPTLTFRAAGVLPGSYDKNFPFAPGNHSTAIEPSFLIRKHFGWQGFGAYGDAFYRWQRTSGEDQYMAAVGLFQQIKGWEIDVGYRHFQCIGGYNINCVPGEPMYYSPQAREVRDSIEAGFSYTTSVHHFKYAFNVSKVFDGANTTSAFWLGAFVDFPIGGKKD